MAKQILRFQKIEFENYRPYKDQFVDFSQNSKLPITIIEGKNAAGKTSIVHAINWCLYGEEKIEDKDKGRPRCFRPVLDSLKTGESFETTVKITLADIDGAKYVISRTITAKRLSDSNEKKWDEDAAGNVPAGITFSTSVNFSERRKDGSWDPTTNDAVFTARIEKILPKTISEFIIFNGEELDDFFRIDSTAKIRKGIEKVSGLPILEITIKHFDLMEKYYRRKLAKAAGATATILNEELEMIQKSIEKFDQPIEIGGKNFDELKVNELQLRIESEKYPVKALETLQVHLEDEKRHKVEYEQAVERFRENRQTFLQEHFTRVLCLDQIKTAYDTLVESQRQGITPPPIYDFYIHELIKAKECMCGNDLDKDKNGLKKLQELARTVSASQLAEIASEGKVILNKLLHGKTNQEICERLDKLRKDEEKFGAAFRESKDRVNGLLTKLEDFDEKKIRKFAKNLVTIREKKDQVWRELELNKSQLAAKQIEEGNKIKELEKAEGETESNKKWKNLHTIANMAKTDLEQIRDELLSDIRETVRKTCQKIFISMLESGRRSAEIKKIDISPSYNIRVLDKTDSDIQGTLSAGQYLFLSLAYIAAVREVTDTNYPMIIDSPLGKISGEERVEVAEILPIYLPETQISFLITNTELDAIIESDAESKKRIPSVREVWQKNKKIWKRWLLKVGGEEEGTQIIEVKS